MRKHIKTRVFALVVSGALALSLTACTKSGSVASSGSQPSAVSPTEVSPVAADNVTFRDESGKVILNSTHIKSVKPTKSDGENYAVLITFTKDSAEILATATANMVGQEMSLYIYDELVFSAEIMTSIANGEMLLGGTYTKEQADSMAEDIEAGLKGGESTTPQTSDLIPGAPSDILKNIGGSNMDGQIIFICILIAVGIVVLRMVISRVIHKGSNAIERAIRPNAAREADNLIGTAVIFEAAASLSAVRRAVADNVPVIDKIGHKMKVLEDSANGISWALGLPGMGQGVVCVLRYKEQSGGTAALFEITQHVTSSGVSPFVKQISELRDQVITALKAADQSVKITTDTQEVKYKMSWF